MRKRILVCLVLFLILVGLFMVLNACAKPINSSATSGSVSTQSVSCIQTTDINRWYLVRCVDVELGNVCYLYGEAISCIKGEIK